MVIYIDSRAKFAPFWSKTNYYIKVSERVMAGSRARHFKMEKEWHSELLKMNSLNLSCLFWMINFWTSLIHLSYHKLLSDSFSAKWASPKLSYIIKLLVYKNRWHHCYCASLCKLPGAFRGGQDSVPNYWNIGVKLFLVNTTFKKKGHVGFFFAIFSIYYL